MRTADVVTLCVLAGGVTLALWYDERNAEAPRTAPGLAKPLDPSTARLEPYTPPAASSALPPTYPSWYPQETYPSNGGLYGAEPGAGYLGGYGGRYGGGSGSSDERDNDALASAKSDFESAADDLRSSVRALGYNDWQMQMPQIRSRLSDAESALEELESLNPDDPAVQAARDEVDTMQRHVGRLHFENWRHVAPDLDSSSRNIESEAYGIQEEFEDE